MTIEERPTGDVMILDLKGKLTIGDGDELLKDKINSLVQQGHTKLILNLAEVPYIDSGGLGQVVRTYTTVKQHNGSLKLMNVTKRIEDLLAITKLLTVFDVFETEQDALQSFS
ncbi:MAG: STAS domain-containing protein [Acidobacteria bacterium]|nr:STAS domain-containing protein [Acidobacteriota bacterium]